MQRHHQRRKNNEGKSCRPTSHHVGLKEGQSSTYRGCPLPQMTRNPPLKSVSKEDRENGEKGRV